MSELSGAMGERYIVPAAGEQRQQVHERFAGTSREHVQHVVGRRQAPERLHLVYTPLEAERIRRARSGKDAP